MINPQEEIMAKKSNKIRNIFIKSFIFITSLVVGFLTYQYFTDSLYTYSLNKEKISFIKPGNFNSQGKLPWIEVFVISLFNLKYSFILEPPVLGICIKIKLKLFIIGIL